MVIVELTGVPGAGKSTAREILHHECKLRGIEVFSRQDMVKSFIRRELIGSYSPSHRFRRFITLFYRIMVWAKCAGIFWNHASLSIFYYRYRKSLYWLTEDVILSNHFRNLFAGKACIYLADEGVIHHISSACVFNPYFRHEAPVWEFFNIFSDLIDSTTVVWLQVDTDVAVQRLLKRGIPSSWPSNINTPSGILSIVVRFESAINFSIAEFNKRGGRIMRVNTTDDIGSIQSKMRCVIDIFIESGRN